ncbi:MAG: hypothetical protein ACJ72N_12130 [Labedaea sp.]
MPDGDTQQGDATPPPPADQQIKNEISTGRVLEWLGGLFGSDWQTTAGGGGTGGQFMFTSLADLDAVISQWKDQRQAIHEDGTKIRSTAALVKPPAGDDPSQGMVNSTVASLEALRQHNQAMYEYADGYIRKLEASRASMANTDQSGKSRMDNVY